MNVVKRGVGKKVSSEDLKHTEQRVAQTQVELGCGSSYFSVRLAGAEGIVCWFVPRTVVQKALLFGSWCREGCGGVDRFYFVWVGSVLDIFVTPVLRAWAEVLSWGCLVDLQPSPFGQDLGGTFLGRPLRGGRQ